nr:polymorphic toxin-type HINT domain-containing protein [Thermoactinomyces sp. DSM 45891]
MQIGDKVLAKDEKTGNLDYKKVVHLFEREVDEIYEVYVSDQKIETTAEHPFWVEGKGWTKVKDLREGDKLQTSEGKRIPIDKIVVKKKHATVYNIEVEGYHTYFVSNLNIFVHNKAMKSPAWVADNRIPLDKETALSSLKKTKIPPVKGAQVYKDGDRYLHRDTFHKGPGAHLEVYDKRGRHLGEADPTTGELISGTIDPTKRINVK